MSQINQVPGTQEEVIEALLENFPNLSAKLQIAARYIIDHPYEVGVQTMRTLANEAGVHPNSFVRLARQIGFDGYDAMRERFRDFVRSGSGSPEERISWLQSMEESGGSAALVSEMYSSIEANQEQAFRDQDVEKLDRAADWLLGAERVYVLGLGAGYPLAYYFWYVARMLRDNFILIPRHGSQALDDIVGIGSDDVLVAMTFQPYRKEIIETQGYAGTRGAKTIGISDSPTASLLREADLGLSVPTHTPHFFHSNAAVSALLETLCALMVARGGSEATRHVREFTELRWRSGIYVE